MSTTYIFTSYGRRPGTLRGPRRSTLRAPRRSDRFAAMGDESGPPDRSERPDRHEHRGGRRGGHGDADFGPGFEPGGGRERGPGFGPRRGRRRASRGDVRAAVLALLTEEPQHGYAVIGLLAERSGGLWRPSPGSIYPVLAALEEDGLVASDTAEGRKVFSLTDAGRAYVAEHADELRAPWTPAHTHHRDRAVALFEAVRSLGNASKEVARNGSDAQVEQARGVTDGARRSLYRILAEPAADSPVPTEPTEPDAS
jgi:DNA-binding PadR family transcriptional regulator